MGQIDIKMSEGSEWQEQTAKTTADSRILVVWTKEEPKELIGFSFADGETTQIDMARNTLKPYYGISFALLDTFHECAKSDSKKVRKHMDKVVDYIGKAFNQLMDEKALELKAQEESTAKDSDGQEATPQ